MHKIIKKKKKIGYLYSPTTPFLRQLLFTLIKAYAHSFRRENLSHLQLRSQPPRRCATSSSRATAGRAPDAPKRLCVLVEQSAAFEALREFPTLMKVAFCCWKEVDADVAVFSVTILQCWNVFKYIFNVIVYLKIYFAYYKSRINVFLNLKIYFRSYNI